MLEGRRVQGPGEVVLRRDYAREHGARVGDTMEAGDRSLRVVGIAATAGSADGAWADPADVLGLGHSRAAGARTASPCG